MAIVSRWGEGLIQSCSHSLKKKKQKILFKGFGTFFTNHLNLLLRN